LLEPFSSHRLSLSTKDRGGKHRYAFDRLRLRLLIVQIAGDAERLLLHSTQSVERGMRNEAAALILSFRTSDDGGVTVINWFIWKVAVPGAIGA